MVWGLGQGSKFDFLAGVNGREVRKYYLGHGVTDSFGPFFTAELEGLICLLG